MKYIAVNRRFPAGGILIMLMAALYAPDSRPLRAADGPANAINAPDQASWELFVDINRSANNGTQDTIWESWATDEDTFPAQPHLNDPPKWPAGRKQPKSFRPSRQIELFRQQLKLRLAANEFHPLIALVGTSEEVRRNKPTFDFIIQNGLWHLNGLADAAKSGKSISFPPESVEIKAHWKAITTDAEKKKYHWNVDGNGKVFGLVALHVTSKTLPNWLWATFEHVDNPERGKALGCHDSFGITPPNSCTGVVSDQLREMFKKAGLGDLWLNYRLAASQIDFTDSTGRPTLVGNSEIEGPFIKTSSCITCHAKAAIDANAIFLPVFNSGRPSEGDVGTPDSRWFYNSDQSRKNIQLDFIWGFSAASPLPNP